MTDHAASAQPPRPCLAVDSDEVQSLAAAMRRVAELLDPGRTRLAAVLARADPWTCAGPEHPSLRPGLSDLLTTLGEAATAAPERARALADRLGEAARRYADTERSVGTSVSATDPQASRASTASTAVRSAERSR